MKRQVGGWGTHLPSSRGWGLYSVRSGVVFVSTHPSGWRVAPARYRYGTLTCMSQLYQLPQDIHVHGSDTCSPSHIPKHSHTPHTHLVQLSHSPEHSLARGGALLGSKYSRGCGGGGVIPTCSEADNVGCVPPQGSHKGVRRASQQLHHVVIERVHVLHQPVVTAIVHLVCRRGRGWEGGGGVRVKQDKIR